LTLPNSPSGFPPPAALRSCSRNFSSIRHASVTILQKAVENNHTSRDEFAL
jgi:hypothetical protein